MDVLGVGHAGSSIMSVFRSAVSYNLEDAHSEYDIMTRVNQRMLEQSARKKEESAAAQQRASSSALVKSEHRTDFQKVCSQDASIILP